MRPSAPRRVVHVCAQAELDAKAEDLLALSTSHDALRAQVGHARTASLGCCAGHKSALHARVCVRVPACAYVFLCVCFSVCLPSCV